MKMKKSKSKGMSLNEFIEKTDIKDKRTIIDYGQSYKKILKQYGK